MSEEEAIKELESLSPSEEAINKILDLYNKEKEKNERLVDRTIKYDKTLEHLQRDTISKDKIREKFLYYQNLYREDNSPNEFLISQDCLSKLSILQELLLEE